MYIYLIPDTKYQELNKCIFSTCSFYFILHQIFLKYRSIRVKFGSYKEKITT